MGGGYCFLVGLGGLLGGQRTHGLDGNIGKVGKKGVIIIESHPNNATNPGHPI